MIRLFLEECKTHCLILLVLLILSVLSLCFMTSAWVSSILSSFIYTFFCFFFIIYLSYHYYKRFYGKYAVTIKSMSIAKWKPFLVYIIFSLCLLLLTCICRSIISFSMHMSFLTQGPSGTVSISIFQEPISMTIQEYIHNTPIHIKEIAWTSVSLFKGFAMVLTTIYFVISFAYSNYFNRNRSLIGVGILIVLVILISILNRLFIWRSIVATYFIFSVAIPYGLDIMLFILFLSGSLYLYTRHGIIQT